MKTNHIWGGQGDQTKKRKMANLKERPNNMKINNFSEVGDSYELKIHLV